MQHIYIYIDVYVHMIMKGFARRVDTTIPNDVHKRAVEAHIKWNDALIRGINELTGYKSLQKGEIEEKITRQSKTIVYLNEKLLEVQDVLEKTRARKGKRQSPR